MSLSERKAVMFIMFLTTFIEEGHLRIYADGLEPVLKKLSKCYSKQIDERTYNKMNLTALKIKEEILKSGIKSTSLMMLAFVIFTADTFLMYVKGERQDLWQELKDKAMSMTARKKADGKFNRSFGNEYDKANILIDIIWGSVK